MHHPAYLLVLCPILSSQGHAPRWQAPLPARIQKQSKEYMALSRQAPPRGNKHHQGDGSTSLEPERPQTRSETSARPIALELRAVSHHNDRVTGTAPLGIRSRRHGLIVGAAADAEVALLGPIRIPGVGDLPILLAVLDAP